MHRNLISRLVTELRQNVKARGFTLIAQLLPILCPCVFLSCGHKPDARLIHAESIMENHPDSALQLLEGLKLPDNSNKHDVALYNLLITHARYKNFIDETNDSLILMSAEYFIKINNPTEASKALFLAGMIQYNARNLDLAAVSFSKGFDLATINNIYFWAGQCASGLFYIYCDLFDGSSQLYYANRSFEAFAKGEYEDWKDYSQLNIAKALNNNGQSQEAKNLSLQLQAKSKVTSDSLLYGESSALLGLILYQTGNYEGALRNYEYAININPKYLNDNDIKIISIAISKIEPSLIPKGIKEFIDTNIPQKQYIPAFSVLAEQKKYEEAYQELIKYQIEEDSVINLISYNNVSKSINQYKDMDAKIKAERHARHLTFYFGLGSLLLSICVIALLLVRIKLNKKKMQITKLMIDMEIIRKDLEMHLQKENEQQLHLPSDKNSKPFIQVIKEKYSEANAICDYYYQSSGCKTTNKKINKEAEELIRELTEIESLKNITRYVDSISNNIYSSFCREMYNISEDYRRLFLYILLGFGARSISVLFNQRPSAIYNKKSRLKSYINKSDASRKDEYLNILK